VSDQERSVGSAEPQPRHVLDQELLDLLGLGVAVVDDQRRDLLDIEQAAGQRASLALNKEEVATPVRCTANGDRCQDAELLDGPAELAVAVTVALPTEAFLRSNPRDGYLLEPKPSRRRACQG
jgi:hypothetical protein